MFALWQSLSTNKIFIHVISKSSCCENIISRRKQSLKFITVTWWLQSWSYRYSAVISKTRFKINIWKRDKQVLRPSHNLFTGLRCQSFEDNKVVICVSDVQVVVYLWLIYETNNSSINIIYGKYFLPGAIIWNFKLAKNIYIIHYRIRFLCKLGCKSIYIFCNLPEDELQSFTCTGR